MWLISVCVKIGKYIILFDWTIKWNKTIIKTNFVLYLKFRLNWHVGRRVKRKTQLPALVTEMEWLRTEVCTVRIEVQMMFKFNSIDIQKYWILKITATLMFFFHSYSRHIHLFSILNCLHSNLDNVVQVMIMFLNSVTSIYHLLCHAKQGARERIEYSSKIKNMEYLRI